MTTVLKKLLPGAPVEQEPEIGLKAGVRPLKAWPPWSSALGLQAAAVQAHVGEHAESLSMF